MTALVFPREKVIRQLVAASQRTQSPTKPRHPTPVDRRYEQLRMGMAERFTSLGWPHRIDISSFIFVNRQLTLANVPSVVSSRSTV
jgi:hypothetical protein